MPSRIAVLKPLIVSKAIELLCTKLVLTLPSGTGPTGRLCALTYGCEADRVSPRLINTRCFGTKSFAATFKFGFASTKSTFEVTGCGLIVIAGERENQWWA